MKVFVLEESFISYVGYEFDYTRINSVYSTMEGAQKSVEKLIAELIAENGGEVSESSDNYAIIDTDHGTIEFAINEQEVLA